jgi:2-polyprenyl-3-methyl-5-hydroxy-6-metoxy-1,4-benzoquinol methylase
MFCMSLEERVRAHFDADARRFDGIYRTEKGFVARFVDDFWRGVVRKRLEINIQRLEPVAGKSILDVGCGSGRFCVAYAVLGASRVVGVDLAPSMIRLAREAAQSGGVGDRCEFRIGSFCEVIRDEVFDASTANGFFDYVDDPVPIIRRMREVTRETMVMSFPKVFEWRVPPRWIRFQLNGCPLHLYTRRRVREVLSEAGIAHFEWVELDRDYLVIVHL